MKSIVFGLILLLLFGCHDSDSNPCDGFTNEACWDRIVGEAVLNDSSAAWLPDETRGTLILYDSVGGNVMQYESWGIEVGQQKAVVRSYEREIPCSYRKTCSDYIVVDAPSMSYNTIPGVAIEKIYVWIEKNFTIPIVTDSAYLAGLADQLVVRVIAKDYDSSTDFIIQKDSKPTKQVILNDKVFEDVFEIPSKDDTLYYNYTRGIVAIRYKGILRTIQ